GLGLTLEVAGQRISADISVQQILTDVNNTPFDSTDDRRDLLISLRNASLSFGDGTTTYASLSNGFGDILLTDAGVTGAIGGTIQTSIPGVSFSGSFNLLLNTAPVVVEHTFVTEVDASGNPVATV